MDSRIKKLKTGYRSDNDDCLPEGNSFSQINRALDQPDSGSIKQIQRACIDDSGTKAAGSSSDETDVANNYEGFILMGEPSGSLELTLQGRNRYRQDLTNHLNQQVSENQREWLLKTIEHNRENNLAFIEKQHENLKQTNEHFFPFSMILKS